MFLQITMFGSSQPRHVLVLLSAKSVVPLQILNCKSLEQGIAINYLINNTDIRTAVTSVTSYPTWIAI